jgi:uncharacterized protein YjbI with pentapeptide repeats
VRRGKLCRGFRLRSTHDVGCVSRNAKTHLDIVVGSGQWRTLGDAMLCGTAHPTSGVKWNCPCQEFCPGGDDCIGETEGMDTEELLERYAVGKRRFGLDLKEGDLSGKNLANVDLVFDLSEINLAGANLMGSNLAGVRLIGANLEGANLTESNLERVDLSRSNLSDTICDRIKLHDAVLAHANMKNIVLAEALLYGANLFRANLSNGCLVEAHFDDASLREADLTGSDLTDGRFRRVDFRNANLTNAILMDISLEEADLRGATGVNLKGAYLRNTILPDGEVVAGPIQDW